MTRLAVAWRLGVSMMGFGVFPDTSPLDKSEICGPSWLLQESGLWTSLKDTWKRRRVQSIDAEFRVKRVG